MRSKFKNRLVWVPLWASLMIAGFILPARAGSSYIAFEAYANRPHSIDTFVQPVLNATSPPDALSTALNSAADVNCLADNDTLCFHDPVAVTEVGNNVYGVEAGLLNGGTKLDVVATAMGADKMKIRLGCGNGSFGCGGYTWAMGDGPSDLAIADFDGDNKTDIVATNHWQGQVRIRWGSSNWSTFTNFSTGQKPWRIATADLNGDGLDDFATTNFAEGDNHSITVRLRKAAGSFLNDTYSAAPGNNDVKFGDCDNDGDLDVFYPTGYNDTAALRVRKNNGSGGFGAPSSLSVAQGNNSEVMAIALADLNEDGKLDFVLSRTNHTLVRGLGTGNCTFQNLIYATVPNNPWQIYVTDFNLDGHQDLIVGHGISTRITIYLGKGNGDVTGPYTIDTKDHVYDLALGDFNQDGLPDIVFSGSTTVYILLTDKEPNSLVYQGLLHSVLGSAQAAVQNDRLLVQNFDSSGSDGLSVQLNQARVWNGKVEMAFANRMSTTLTAVETDENERNGVSHLTLRQRDRSLSFSAAFNGQPYTVEYLYEGEIVNAEHAVPSGNQATQLLLDELACVLEGSSSYLCNLAIEFQQNAAGQCQWTVAFKQAISMEVSAAAENTILVDSIRLVEEAESTPGARMAFSEIQIQGAELSSLALDTETVTLEEDLHFVYLPTVAR